jgi:glycosyltransferase involved in cell wall biosynthesis
VEGGGALRTSSIAEYLRQRYEFDLVVFQAADAAPPERATSIIRLPRHSKAFLPRAARNLRRLVTGVPPLMERFAGVDRQIQAALAGNRYDVAVIEHLWAAPYVDIVAARSRRTILDLHNIESLWHERAAQAEPGPAAYAMRRWAERCRSLERDLLPRFSEVLVTSEADGQAARAIAHDVNIVCYPNAIPYRTRPERRELRSAVVFSGNFEYRPNVSAVLWFGRKVWPRIAAEVPGLEWHLVGKNPDGVRAALRGVERVRVIGAVADAVAELAAYRAAVVPLLWGSGTRLKIIEAWAAGTPVISTPAGVEGLDARDGEEVVVASPETYAEAVISLLKDQNAAGRMGDAGRCNYEKNYTWNVAWSTLRRLGL